MDDESWGLSAQTDSDVVGAAATHRFSWRHPSTSADNVQDSKGGLSRGCDAGGSRAMAVNENMSGTRWVRICARSIFNFHPSICVLDDLWLLITSATEGWRISSRSSN